MREKIFRNDGFNFALLTYEMKERIDEIWITKKLMLTGFIACFVLPW